MNALESGKLWRTEISWGLFLKVRYSLSPELWEKISFWHDVENTREMMKKVMLKREYGDVFDYGWAAVVWIKETEGEKLLKIKNKSEKKNSFY